jgi:uncharacterized membrane protein
MAEANDKTRRWRSQFGAKKMQFAPDAPADAYARTAFHAGIVAVATTLAAVILVIVGVWWLRWIALVVWLAGLPFAVRAALRGKFEGDAIDAGRAPAKGKPLAAAGIYMGLGSAGLAAIVLIVLFVIAVWPSPTLSGKYGDANKTFDEYMKAIRSGDFNAYLDCLTAGTREGKDRAYFEKLRNRRASQDINILDVEYSDGGTNARDAKRADLRVRCYDKSSGPVDVGVRMVREADGWKIASSDL